MRYSYKEIEVAYRELGVSRGMTLSLKSDMRLLGLYESIDQLDMLEAHFNVLADIVDLNEGTIVVSTATLSLCNTDNIFDVDLTPSEMGSITEYIRQLEGSKRSFHPFTSYAAIGKNAGYVCDNTSKNSVGPNSPQARLLELNASCLSIGLHPIEVSTMIHHIELVMGVPYRYIKEFMHPVKKDGKVINEPFYLHVRYPKVPELNLAHKVYPEFYRQGYRVREQKLGRGKLYLIDLNEFYESTTNLLSNDLYACLDEEISFKPYTI